MSLNDGDIAALAEQAAVLAPVPVRARVEPDSSDDPYRWGRHYWLVHFVTEDGRTAVVRVGADESEQNAASRLADAVGGLRRPEA